MPALKKSEAFQRRSLGRSPQGTKFLFGIKRRKGESQYPTGMVEGIANIALPVGAQAFSVMEETTHVARSDFKERVRMMMFDRE